MLPLQLLGDADYFKKAPQSPAEVAL